MNARCTHESRLNTANPQACCTRYAKNNAKFVTTTRDYTPELHSRALESARVARAIRAALGSTDDTTSAWKYDTSTRRLPADVCCCPCSANTLGYSTARCLSHKYPHSIYTTTRPLATRFHDRYFSDRVVVPTNCYCRDGALRIELPTCIPCASSDYSFRKYNSTCVTFAAHSCERGAETVGTKARARKGESDR